MSALVSRSPADVWANLNRLYPVYSALACESAIEVQPCLELVEAIKVPSAEMIAEAEKWFAGIDEKIRIQHLRQFVQTSSLVNDAVLRDLLVHNLNNQTRTEHDRDKIDFLLVQFFSEQAPSDLGEDDLNLEAVAKGLEPVLGPVEITEPEYLNALNDLLREANDDKSLNSLFTARVIERGRQIKESCGDKFFEPLTMVSFARFGFLMRRTFFRLMHQDLNAILDGLRELESRGLSTIDCRKAQFSAEEPISRLRMICQSWKVMFHAEYSAGQPLCILVDLRTAVEAALRQGSGGAKAMAAGGGVSGDSAHGEFEVSGTPISGSDTE
jgi:hypothetical protein